MQPHRLLVCEGRLKARQRGNYSKYSENSRGSCTKSFIYRFFPHSRESSKPANRLWCVKLPPDSTILQQQCARQRWNLWITCPWERKTPLTLWFSSLKFFAHKKKQQISHLVIAFQNTRQMIFHAEAVREIFWLLQVRNYKKKVVNNCWKFSSKTPKDLTEVSHKM